MCILEAVCVLALQLYAHDSMCVYYGLSSVKLFEERGCVCLCVRQLMSVVCDAVCVPGCVHVHVHVCVWLYCGRF